MEAAQMQMNCLLCNEEAPLQFGEPLKTKITGDYTEGQPMPIPKTVYYSIAICNKCRGVLLLSSETSDDSVSIDSLKPQLLWPTPDELPEEVHSEVVGCYKEAKKYEKDNPKNYALNIRLALEAICINSGIECDNRRGEKKRLAELIDILVKRKKLPSVIKEMMGDLKDIGNFGAHNSDIEVAPEYVPYIRKLFKDVVYYLYVVLPQVQAFKSNIRSLKEQQRRRNEVSLFNPRYELLGCSEKLFDGIASVAASGMYVSGMPDEQAQCFKFEKKIKKRCEIDFAIGVSSGTTALELLLRADDVGPGDKVVTTAHTFVAALEAILAVGAEPMFVDIDPGTWQMPQGDWNDHVVMVCHLYGGASAAVHSKARLLYEDASQSFGGKLNDKWLGTLTRASAISLYPTKNLSAMGDAGVILTNDEQLADRLRALRNHGQTKAQQHDYRGTTGRLDEIQAAILSEKLNHFGGYLEARRKAADIYIKGLQGIAELTLPTQIPNSAPAPNLFVVRTKQRDELKECLKSKGIITGIHYPTPLHQMPAYRNESWAKVSLPHTERLCNEILTLPLWVGISEEQQERVVKAIRQCFEESRRSKSS